MQIGQARRRYIRWLIATRDLSPHTIRAYDSDLVAFERHLGAAAPVTRIDRECCLTFAEDQRARGLAPSSLRRRTSGLRGFCRWLIAQQLLDSDPSAGTTFRTGKSRRLPQVVPSHELDQLLRFLRQATGVEDLHDPEQLGMRPHEATTFLAVALMVATGVRVHEAVGIRRRDVDLTGRSIRLTGKGRRERQVFLPSDWIGEFAAAYAEMRATLGIAHPHLLFNLRLDPLSTSAMRSRLAKAARAAGLSQRVTPHMLRHTAATQLIEAGVDIRYIQRLLGHASLSTTEIYTHVSDRALRQVVSEADVLGRLAQGR